MNCRQCGKEIPDEKMLFCPYCGAKLGEEPAQRKISPEVEEWLRKVKAASNLPKRKDILEAARHACPDEPELEWEWLFIGHKNPKPPRGMMDFSIIKCYLLHIYRKPEVFSAARREEMRREIFGDPQLQRCLALSDNPDRKLEEYLLRLTREYIELFLEDDNQVMGVVFGFRLSRNKAKRLAEPVAYMLQRIKTDEGLTAEQREQLFSAFYKSFSLRMEGETAWLDEKLAAMGG